MSSEEITVFSGIKDAHLPSSDPLRRRRTLALDESSHSAQSVASGPTKPTPALGQTGPHLIHSWTRDSHLPD